MRTALIACCLALLLAGTVAAGGFATVGIANPPTRLEAGDTWPARIEILQHGITPMDGLRPSLIVKDGGGRERRFPARPAGKPGLYRADVVFPSAGRFDYRVDDGFTNRVPHTFPAVEVLEPRPAAAAAAAGFPFLPVAGVLLLSAALALVILGMLRRRQRAVAA